MVVGGDVSWQISGEIVALHGISQVTLPEREEGVRRTIVAIEWNGECIPARLRFRRVGREGHEDDD